MFIMYRKHIRLKYFDYRGCRRYYITLCTFDRRAKFLENGLIDKLIEIFKNKSGYFGFIIWAYCFMPDHVHLLIEGGNESSDLEGFVKAFKQESGYYYKKVTGEFLWQKHYYEHVLRQEEGTENICRYIFNNPVRKGLVDEYHKYRFSGSFEFNIKEF